eukprot:8415756-Alexandrium_andersonii.AAC.1
MGALKKKTNDVKTPRQSWEHLQKKEWDVSDKITAIDAHMDEIRTEYAATMDHYAARTEKLLIKRAHIR